FGGTLHPSAQTCGIRQLPHMSGRRQPRLSSGSVWSALPRLLGMWALKVSTERRVRSFSIAASPAFVTAHLTGSYARDEDSYVQLRVNWCVLVGKLGSSSTTTFRMWDA